MSWPMTQAMCDPLAVEHVPAYPMPLPYPNQITNFFIYDRTTTIVRIASDRDLPVNAAAMSF